jgi:hypothetical protein
MPTVKLVAHPRVLMHMASRLDCMQGQQQLFSRRNNSVQLNFGQFIKHHVTE